MTRSSFTRFAAGALLFGYAAAGLSASVQDYVREAKSYQAKGEYRSAVIQLKNALQQQPKHADARLLLGEVYLKMGDGAAAEKELLRAKDLGIDASRYLLPLGRSYLQQGQPKRVLEQIKAQGTVPVEVRADISALRGRAYLLVGELAKAQDEFAAGLRLNPRAPDLLIGQAQLQLAKQDLAAAERSADAAIAADARNVEGWLMKGELKRLKKDMAGARDAFQKVLTIEPENVLARLGRATALVGLRQVDLAAKDVDAVRQAAPQHPLANFLHAVVLLNQNKTAEAAETLQRVLLVAPNHAPSYLLLGMTHYGRNELEQASESLSKFLGIQPDHVPARKLLAAVHLRLKQPQRAMETLDIVAKQAGGDPQLLSLLGSAYMQKGEYAKGTEYIEKAVAINPEAALLRTQLAMSHLADGKENEALSALKSAVQLDQGLAQADILLVLTELHKRNYDGAAAAAQAFIKKSPKNPVAYNLLGAAYQGKGDIKRAREQYQNALRIAPRYSTAELNLARLDQQQGSAESARTRYSNILAYDDKHVGAMLGLAQLALRSGDKEKAIGWLERARNRNPGAIEPSVLLSDYYLRENDALKALTIARELADEHPSSPIALQALGRAQLANGQHASAISSLRKVAEIAPKSADAQYILATAYIEADNLKAAREALGRALKLQPSHLGARVALAGLEVKDKRPQEALRIARELQKQQPKAPQGYSLEGDVQMALKNSLGAAAAYAQAFERAPGAALAMAQFRAHWQAGAKNAAYEALARWLKASPRDVATRMALASALEGEYPDRAILQYEEVLKIDASNVAALNNAAWLYHARGDARALKYAEQAYRLKNNDPAVVDTYGWILLQRGQVAEGLKALRYAATHAPHVAEIRYHLAVALEKANQPADARKELERLLRAQNDFAQRREAEAMLRRMQ